MHPLHPAGAPPGTARGGRRPRRARLSRRSRHLCWTSAAALLLPCVLAATGSPPARTPRHLARFPIRVSAYVANSGSRTVSVYDTQLERQVGAVQVGHGPTGVGVSPDGDEAY